MFVRCQENGCGIGADPNHDSQWDVTCGVRNCYLKRQFQARNKRFMLLITALVGLAVICGWAVSRAPPPRQCDAYGSYGQCVAWRTTTE
jgi:hypothetical protein